jgi:hypothetical protein
VPAGPQGGYPVQTLRPGASVAASIADGDISLGSVGTVAYRDGSNVWLFGHPLDAEGPRNLFLQDAYVFTVVNNPIGIPDLGTGTYKLATAGGHTVGTVTNDADAAVVGRVGTPPGSVALAVSARDLDTGRGAFADARLADERALGLGSGAGLVAPLALAQTIDHLLRSTAPARLRMCVRFKARELPRRFGFCNPYFSGDEALTELSEVADLVDAYDFSPFGLTQITARAKLRRGVLEDAIVRARAPRRVRAGLRIRVRLLLRRRRGATRRLDVRFRLPRSLRRGFRTLVLEGSGAPNGDSLEFALETDLLDLLGPGDGGGGGDEPHSVAELVRRVEARKRRLGITARYRKRGHKTLVYASNDVLFSGRVKVPLRVVRRGRR